MTEAELQRGLVEAAKLAGWMTYHTYDSRRSEPGFPDLVLVHPIRARLMFIECKGSKGRVSTYQRRWLNALGAVSNSIEADGGNRMGSRLWIDVCDPDNYDDVLRDIMGVL